MGRENPSVGMAPNANRRQERAKRARETVNKVIPDILRGSPRARHGIHKAELVVDPELNTHHTGTPTTSSTIMPERPTIRLHCTDTLAAAAKLSDRPFASKRTTSTLKTCRQQKPNVAVLNMASPLKPGGGFLDGANSQEEFLCCRTTLYPSLWDSFYRLPELGGVWTPEVLVFRDSTPEANELAKRDRYFIDVISAGMLRFPDTANRGRSSDELLEGKCSCGVSYCDRDRELVTRKMKAVLRMAELKGIEKLVLGAWGCGAYGNPVKEIAKIWRKVIVGSTRQRRPNAEQWEGIKEIVFAIPDRTMLREFQHAFADVLTTDLTSSPPASDTEDVEAGAATQSSLVNEDRDFAELVDKIQETELQSEQLTNARSKARLRDVLANLNRELAQGLAAKQFKDEDLTHTSDEEVDDMIVVTGTDGEDNSMYNFDENDVASSSSLDSGCETSEVYDFRRRGSTRPGLNDGDHGFSHDDMDVDDLHSPADYPTAQPSPRFDAKTGWFAGSIDDFHGYLRGNGSGDETERAASHCSPVLRPDSSAGPVIDELLLEEYLGRYEGTDGARVDTC
ncbi:hypothetical protein LTR36_000773 [Oleoguttula mirabilis]|uniref:Microbial-type PARG catalytic domain-containing protein n=1 Tax=Oleoguttula mirabilis TaxID=1507867 RepID=A0AAV9J3U5_9PEZI|nr:hypothetical protein LTR36_000773 [Oleoguttula mirabilis]